MKALYKIPGWIAIASLNLVTLACRASTTPTVSAPTTSATGTKVSKLALNATPPGTETRLLTADTTSSLSIQPVPVDPELRNPWPRKWEQEFQQRSRQVLAFYTAHKYGNNSKENEKQSYPYAMFDFLAGNRDKAIAFLQSEDKQAQDNQHTLGIDYYYSFTLKGQIRKYFLWGQFLDPTYKQRMFEGAKIWTQQDPNRRPHPIYGKGDGSEQGWGPKVRGSWVDSRNTDNLRAMREISVYLMAEETGNEAVRRLYQQKIHRYVSDLYHIGMGEWDSETYHGHTLAAYLNLYDFAKDREVKQLAKAALDWLSATGAVKYYHAGFGGPNKRDYGGSNVVFSSDAAQLLWLYFGDAKIPNPKPELDSIHVMTSAYRPPQAAVALARKQFAKPVELLITHPTYENWKPGASDQPAYWETTFFGQTYQLGSVVSSFKDGDVGPFKLMVQNSQRGMDYFVANTGGDRVESGKHRSDQMGQYRNLMLWLRPASETPFFFQVPKSARAEVEKDIWFFQFENTWLAVYPINLRSYAEVAIADPKTAERYQQERTLKAVPQDGSYTGFALEIGEPTTHGRYEQFKQAVINKSKLDLSRLAQGTAKLQGATGETLEVRHNNQNELPTVVRNGVTHDWMKHLDLYKPVGGNSPISLGWKQGKLRVAAGGATFETKVKAAVRVEATP
uniref:hypothetical protein n=1 Tax=Trichocoleus desertorum TaxID=1481672 RepID=UPI0025B387DE|nr:hypothetical protein [Trichocoleus desertorum]